MEAWKVISLFLAGLSLFWNVGNTIFTIASNSRNKRRLVNLEEFRSRVRDPLDEVIRKGEALVREAEQMTAQPGFPGDFNDRLEEVNRELMSCMSEIQDRCMDADESRFSDDLDWVDLYDREEDPLMQSMNIAVDAMKTPDERTEALKQCKRVYRRFKKSVSAKVEAQVTALSS